MLISRGCWLIKMGSLFQITGIHKFVYRISYFMTLFCDTGSNANVQRVFSLIGQQWTKDRNRFHVDTLAKIVVVEYNLCHLTFNDFYKIILNGKKPKCDLINT